MKKSPRADLPVQQIGERAYYLNEFDGTNLYLVVGSEKALLMDTGTGFCDVYGAVRAITDKPLLVAVTHGHGDHLGGKGQFPEVYVPKKDLTLFNKMQGTMAFRRFFTAANAPVHAHGFTAADVMKPQYHTKLIPFDGTMVFDLGDRKVTVQETPGHSRGSVAFIDEADGLIFSGDNVCDNLWMMLPGSTSIEEWLPSAKWLLEASRTHKVYWGHRVARLETDYIAQVIQWGEEILQKHKTNAKWSHIALYPHQKDGILYRTGNVRRK